MLSKRQRRTVIRLNAGYENTKHFFDKFISTKWLTEEGQPDSFNKLKEQLGKMKDNINYVGGLDRFINNNSCNKVLNEYF